MIKPKPMPNRFHLITTATLGHVGPT